MLGSREKYLAQGFDGYISKPFNKSALQEILNSTHRTEFAQTESEDGAMARSDL